MKKGSGTFFVYRRFCGESTRSGKQAKAGYHHGDGILPLLCGIKFALCELGRPPIWLTRGNRCVRAYREIVYTSGEV